VYRVPMYNVCACAAVYWKLIASPSVVVEWIAPPE